MSCLILLVKPQYLEPTITDKEKAKKKIFFVFRIVYMQYITLKILKKDKLCIGIVLLNMLLHRYNCEYG
jgi:hypothetical protein